MQNGGHFAQGQLLQNAQCLLSELHLEQFGKEIKTTEIFDE